MGKLIVGVALFCGAARAYADGIPYEPGASARPSAAEVVGASVALMPAMAVASACGLAILPLDAYWKLQRPQDDYATYASDRLCGYAAAVVGVPLYVIAGFPVVLVEEATVAF